MVALLLACSAPFGSADGNVAGIATAGLGGEVPPLVLNELMPRNDSTVMHGALAFPDWIEVYNPGGASVPLSRIAITVGGDVWNGSADLVVGPRGHILLWAGDGDPSDSLGFTLDGGGETVQLAVDGAIADTVDYGDLDGDVAWARFPDGGDWAATTRATPGGMNGNRASDSTDPTDLLFETTEIEDFWITLDAASWAGLSADRFTEVPGSLAWRGAFFPTVGVASKAYVGSSRDLSQKTAWKVDLNQYEDHRLAGIEKLTLNNLVQDPSYLHEDLTYRLYRAVGVPAPRVGYARVYINGGYWGLYANVESPDDTFLDRWYEDGSGALYEGAYGVDFWPGYEWSFEYDEGPDSNDRSRLTALIAALDVPADNAGIANLETLMDMDEFLAMMAVEAVSLHWDGYTTANNYRVYDDPSTGRFQMIPWGTDQTFHDAWFGAYPDAGRLFDYCMSNQACVERYTEKLRECATVLEGLGLEARLDELWNLLYPWIESDPRREHSMDTVSSYVSTTRHYIQTQPGTIRSQLR